MFRTAWLAVTAALLSGCATFASAPAREAANSGSIQKESEPPGALQPASLRAPRVATTFAVGLVPCERGVFPVRNCWRKGDQHVLYPEAPPEGVDASPLKAPLRTASDN